MRIENEKKMTKLVNKDEVIELDVKEMDELEALFDEDTKRIIAEFHAHPTEENLIRAAEAGAKAEERIRAAANR